MDARDAAEPGLLSDQRTQGSRQALGVYVHVPFCASICNYCNFNRGLFDEELKGAYVDALVRDITAGGADPAERADTIYFGGGTPSLLTASEVARIIAACRDAFAVAPDAEITLEANPETVDLESLAALRAAGVNRLSFGVQSLRDDELVRLSRRHSADRARAAYHDARRAGFDNVSLDLMMWLPNQSPSQWIESASGVAALGPDHVSMYMLEVYPNAPLKDAMARAAWSQAPDDDVAEMYLEALALFDRSGYEQYEISNVARPGRRSRHNLKYWTDGEWVGFGCGAHSTRDGIRWKNVSATGDYIGRVREGRSTRVEVKRLTQPERLGDALFTGLRLSDGVDLDIVGSRYDTDVWQRFGADLISFVNEGLLERSGARIRLTRRGMLLAHEIMAVFV
ncbi:MAG: radical SAM family heme chaperone HemW [Vicinamibacterales bacterium]